MTLASDTPSLSHFVIRGGSAASSAGCTAGAGIYGATVTVNSGGSIYGGGGYIAAPALHYDSSCAFGLANIKLEGGEYNAGIFASAISRSSEAPRWSRHAHTTVEETDPKVTVRINQYELKLWGQGGTRGGETSVTLKAEYPAAYDLSGYLFTREGCVQVCWADPYGKTYPLDAVFTPEKDTALDAVWERTVQSYGLADFELTVDYGSHNIRVTPKNAWVSSLSSTGARTVIMALYDSSGRMLDMAVTPYASSGVSALTLHSASYPLPVLKVLAVDRRNCAVVKETVLDLSKLKGDSD